MKIWELVCNHTFDFNAHYKVYQYIPRHNEEGECVLKYDSYSSFDVPRELWTKDITAINQATDGTVEIEFV